MTTLLVGFDSAWTPTNSGALLGVLRLEDGAFRELGSPRIAKYPEAECIIGEWQGDLERAKPGTCQAATIILLDQPTVVKNATGRRPVEELVGSLVGRRHGGMQPANTGKKEMFGEKAPVWEFLRRFGGPGDPLAPATNTRVFETYPVLTMIALDWMLPDKRPAGRLPKYNPERKTFSISDWKHVCGLAIDAFRERGLVGIVGWIEDATRKTPPRKGDQDGLDACLCLLVALYLAEQKDCLMVGNMETGYIVVPYGAGLHGELEARCNETDRAPSEWVRQFRLQWEATQKKKTTVYVNDMVVGEVEVTGDPQKDIPTIREFLKTKGMHREMTMAQAMFRQALSFCTTAKYLYDRDLRNAPWKGLSAAPFVVNSAFSIELYLKTLHHLRGSRTRGHSLLVLYDSLSDETRDVVFSIAQQQGPAYQVGVASKGVFRSFVAELDTAFVDWRYCYETGQTNPVNIQRTILIIKVLHDACRQLGAT